MNDQQKTKPYWVLSRFRMAGKWLEVSEDSIELTDLQAQGPSSIGLITSTNPKVEMDSVKIKKAEKTVGGSDAVN